MNALLESALDKIAKSAADLVRSGDLIGLGSGSTVSRFASALGARIQRESLKLTVVPSSTQAWILAKENGLPLNQDSAHCPTSLDVAVDGADQIALPSRAMIKGGGGALLREKIIISSARRCYILADQNKYVERLTRAVPVEVVQFSLISTEAKLKSGLGASCELRKLDKGYPFFTESGNLILDSQFKEPIANPHSLETKIKMIPGVVEAGIFNCNVEKFFRANQDGTFETL